MDNDTFIPMGDAARILGVTKPRISQLLSSGELTGSLVGGRRMIDRYLAGKAAAVEFDASRTFVLMSAAHEVAVVRHDPRKDNPLVVREIFDSSRMPLGTVTSGGKAKPRSVTDWWEHRSVPASRPGLLARLGQIEIADFSLLPLNNMALSLSDCYWLRPATNETLQWGDVNYFDNNFVQSNLMTWDNWLSAVGLDSPDNTSEGELPKRWTIRDGVRCLAKGCTGDDQRPFNEVVATALHRRLLQPGEYVPYTLAHIQDGPLCLCPNFLGEREEYVPAALVRGELSSMRGATTYDRLVRFAERHACDAADMHRALSQMIICDAILANTDRHWRNFGFIRSVDTLQMRPAPLFDSGNSLWYNKTPQQVERNDWTFQSRPFDPNPAHQLALANDLSWYDPAAFDHATFDHATLSGFVDEAVEILSNSKHATANGRLSYIARGLQKRVDAVSAVVETLQFVHRGWR